MFHIHNKTDTGELRAIFECKLQKYLILYKYTLPTYA